MILLIPVCLRAQPKTEVSAYIVDSLLNVVFTDQILDSERKSNLVDSAFHLALQHEDICRQVIARIRQATHLDNMGMADSALTQLYWASQSYRADCDSILLMELYGNLTNVFLSLEELNRVDSVSHIALTLWNHRWKEKESRFAILNNQAIAQAMRGDTTNALIHFRQAYSEALLDSNEEYIQKGLLNLGTIKGLAGDLDSASYFLTLAANNARVNEDIYSYMTLMVNLANVEMERGKFQAAITLLDTTFAMAEPRKYTEILASVQNARSDLYFRMGRHKEAYNYLREYNELRDQYLDEERVKAVTEMMEKYESEKKARQIQELELDNLEATLKNERITNTRNRYLYIGGGILLIAIGLWTRLRYIHRSRKAIQHEKDISEGLLLNILPSAVAEELKSKGYADARNFNPTTVLFSDFIGFTTVSEKLTPAQLVEEINVYFKAFDEITTTFNIEKIKTIGDAYMAAGGLMTEHNTATVAEVVLAGIDMQRFVTLRKKEKEEKNLPAFNMRIGIHSGPVVAGIVGVKKFQYDLWGDTVNIASRMETNSEVGKVNISEATYKIIRDDPRFRFKPRGLTHVKGKGEMAMYFVDLAS